MKRTLILALGLLTLSASLPAAEPAAFSFDFSAERYGAVTPTGEISRLDSWLENTGSEADTFTFVMTGALPLDWGLSACAGTLCYPPWVTTFEVELLAGESILIAIDVTPLTSSEGGTINMTATSTGDPGQVVSRDFTVLAPGSDVLFVDADGGFAYEVYFHDALATSGATYQTWNRTTLGFLAADDLSRFGAVVWNADLTVPTLTDTDRTALAGFVAGHGDLLLSGQDIAFDLASPSGATYTPATQLWYQEITGASFSADDSNDVGLSGVSGDPIGDGLLFNIAGGSSANNQGAPDVLTPSSSARAFLEYSPGQAAAVRYLIDGAHIVTLGFGFEGIDTAAHRTALMTAVLDWFAVEGPTAVGDLPGAGRLTADPRAHPNPFNPSTKLSFSVAGDGSIPVTVEVFDLAGRRVKRLLETSLPAGDHGTVWDGRDDRGARVPSGVYLARVRAGAEVRAAKLMLAK